MKKTHHIIFLLLTVSISTLFACSTVVKHPVPNNQKVTHPDKPVLDKPVLANTLAQQHLVLSGQWLVDENGKRIINPQPSGLTVWQDQLVMIADASADDAQVKRLHFINPENAQRRTLSPIYTISESLQQTCFNQYLLSKPDLEALVKDPANPQGFITVTEDASVLGKLSSECAVTFKDTNSTLYPTVLVRLEWDGENLFVTGVRAVQFPQKPAVGNYPNDGIEGLSVVDNTLFIALEKDAQFRARIFSTVLTDDFWLKSEFVSVVDEALTIPELNQKGQRALPHPINGTDTFEYEGSKWLLAAARNDNQLWLIDVAKQRPTKVVDVTFMAPTQMGLQPAPDDCPAYTQMDNASLEGVAVAEGVVYLVNDPWKRNYWKNIQCESTRSAYAEQMNGLLFKTTLEVLFSHARDISAE